MTYGVVLVQDLPWPEWRRRLLEVEALGYDAVHVWDHLVHRTLDDSDVLMESFGVLSAAAAVTTRIRLGTLVVSPTLRHPYLLTKQAMTLDRVSQGRFDLGIGAAGAVADFVVLGQEQPSPAELVDRFLATVECVLRYRPLPLTLAAHGPRTLRIAARHASTWTVIADRDRAPGEAVAAARARAALLDRYAEEAGRDPATIRRSVLLGSAAWPVRRSARDFADAVERFRAIGFDDFLLMYPDHPAEAGIGHGAAAPDIVRSVAELLGLSPRQ
jgi:alkanesulfonate monooxygenase SsuD/methylene tetrahydromethanopterin reductase-like flavin-dependent oxidoreductase (luciferase family)